MEKNYVTLLFLICVFALTACIQPETGVEVPDVDEYVSSYKPHKGNYLPVIKIVSETGKNDFVTKPKATVVTNGSFSWGGNKAPEPYYEKCKITVIDENQQTFLNEAEGQVKVRGNWTTSYDKKSLRIKFDKKQKMLGLNNGERFKNWVLLASYKDWSFLRDSTALYLAKLMSSDYSSDYRLVEVYINDSYWGVYLLAEQKEVKKNRIDITDVEENYTGTDIGYFMELDNYYTYEDYKFEINYNHSLKDKNNSSVTNFTKGYTIQNDIYSDSQVTFIKNYMNNLWKICYEAAYNQKFYEFNEGKTKLVESSAENSYECVSKVIDINSLVNTYILNEVGCDADIYYSSFFMDVDFGAGKDALLRFECPWDFDSGFGNKNFCADAQGLYAAVSGYDVNHNSRGYGNPWLLVFVNCQWFQDLVKQKWAQMNSQNVSEKLISQIDYVTSQYEQSFIKNYNVWKNAGNNGNVGNELCLSAAACKNQKEAASYLKDWLTKRFISLNGLWL